MRNLMHRHAHAHMHARTHTQFQSIEWLLVNYSAGIRTSQGLGLDELIERDLAAKEHLRLGIKLNYHC